MDRQKTTHPFPRNLICDVYGREVDPEELPSDIDESVIYVLDNMMPERDAFILILRYMRNMSNREIAAYYGLSKARIYQIIYKAHRQLRHPSRFKYFKDGYAKVAQEKLVLPEDQVLPADPRPDEALADIADVHIRVDAIMARGALNRIEWLGLPIRAYNCLVASQVENVWQLCLLSPAALLQIKDLGDRTLVMIQEKLCALNLGLDDGTMGTDDQTWDYAEQRYAALAMSGR